jgi:SAM-dependent methyltransferase
VTCGMILLYTVAVFLSAALLFTLQPMIAKRLLPLLGGSPAVWNTAMMFFQTALLAGYAGAHHLSKRLSPGARIAVHGVLLAAALPFLPLALHGGDPPASAGSPVPWLVGALASTCGIAFLALAMTGPLLQHAFSRTDHAHASDPYFLFAASNAGSIGGLLAYPFLIETTLSLTEQERLWSWLYVVAALIVVTAGIAAARRPGIGASPERRKPKKEIAERNDEAAWRERGFWVLCAFVPSSLTIGITQSLTTDFPPIPLLWVLPLVVYLGTFVVAFSRGRKIPVRGVGHVLALLTVAYAASTVMGRGFLEAKLAIAFNLALLGAAALLAHGRLADSRPPAVHLTRFYLWVAVGGALGGVFNALVAPLIFVRLTEVPLALTLALLLRPSGGKKSKRVLDVALPIAIAGSFLVASRLVSGTLVADPDELLKIQAAVPAALLLLGVPWRARFAAGAAVLFLAGEMESSVLAPNLHQERTFYGLHRVARRERHHIDRGVRLGSMSFIALEHGSTLHGTQLVEPALRDVPTTYYHPSGPIGHVFATLGPAGKLREVAIVGLGAGTLAAYGEPGRRFTVFELDPAVIEIARDERLFSYVARSRSPIVFVPGDGRLSLARADEGAFDLVVLDAFGSDAIPIHLLTVEAFRTYLRTVAPGGLIAVHATNQYLDLVPVIAAAAADLQLFALVRSDRIATKQQFYEGKEGSVWVVLARDASTLALLAADKRWNVLPRGAGTARAWTDESSSVFEALRLER